MPSFRRTLPVLLALALTGCARGIDVGSAEPSRTYSINVHNDTGVAMIVSYNDGRGDAILGHVAAGATERFIIAAPASTTISVRGSAASGSPSAGPYTVTLLAGTPQTVRLR